MVIVTCSLHICVFDLRPTSSAVVNVLLVFCNRFEAIGQFSHAQVGRDARAALHNMTHTHRYMFPELVSVGSFLVLSLCSSPHMLGLSQVTVGSILCCLSDAVNIFALGLFQGSRAMLVAHLLVLYAPCGTQ